MSTRIEAVVARMVVALDGAGKPAGLNVHRYRTRSLRDDTLPAIVVFNAGADEERHERGQGTSLNLEVALECRAKASDAVAPDQAVDPLLEWVVESLRRDSTLQSLVDDFDNLRLEYRAEIGEDGPRAALGIIFPLRVDALWDDYTKV